MRLIRNAFPRDAVRLTAVALAGKRYWNYPDSYMEQFRRELGINADYILDPEHIVRCWEESGSVFAFYSVVHLPEPRQSGAVALEAGYWLAHMFVHPACLKKGIGTGLFTDMKMQLAVRRADRVRILVDPNAKGFYDKMGAKLVRYSDSSIPGRKIPVYEYLLPVAR